MKTLERDTQGNPAKQEAAESTFTSPRKPLWRRYILLVDLLLLVVLWHMAAVNVDAAFLPTPGAVWGSFTEELALDEGETLSDLPDDHLITHTITSTRRLGLSLLFSVLLAVPLALLTAQIRLLDAVLTPLLTFAYPAPKVVFLPLIILFLGLGDESRVFLVTLVLFFQVFVIVHDTAVQVQPETLESINSLGANVWHRLRYVYLPVSIPAVITALKISTGTAIAVLYISEGIAGRTGLGYMINFNYSTLNYDRMYAAILMISILGLGLFAVFAVLERYFTRWQNTR
jgi:NitT/TauT family transport system permease protein